jgi:release factor glutamine methyltransferase
MTSEAWTVKKLLHWTQNFLQEKGIDSPRADAEILLAHVLQCKRIDLYVRSEELPEDAARTTYKELIKRRVESCPVAYLVGQKDFFLLTFEVTPAVLIPRPETEELVVETLRLIKEHPSPRILDIGTGSGCIAISVVHQNRIAQLTALDISKDALDAAIRNAKRHNLADRIRFLESDLFAAIPQGQTFDVIVSNPPYIAQCEFPSLSADVRDHEPRLALDGGPDGLRIYRRLIADAPKFLAAAGTLLMEIGWQQEPAVRELIEAQGSFETIRTIKDHAGHPRVITAKRPAS